VTLAHRLRLSCLLRCPVPRMLGRFFTVYPAGVAHGDEGVPGYAEEEDEASQRAGNVRDLKSQADARDGQARHPEGYIEPSDCRCLTWGHVANPSPARSRDTGAAVDQFPGRNVSRMWAVIGSRLQQLRGFFAAHTIAYAIFLAGGAALTAALDHLTTGRPWADVTGTATGMWMALMGLYSVRKYGGLTRRR